MKKASEFVPEVRPIDIRVVRQVRGERDTTVYIDTTGTTLHAVFFIISPPKQPVCVFGFPPIPQYLLIAKARGKGKKNKTSDRETETAPCPPKPASQSGRFANQCFFFFNCERHRVIVESVVNSLVSYRGEYNPHEE